MQNTLLIPQHSAMPRQFEAKFICKAYYPFHIETTEYRHMLHYFYVNYTYSDMKSTLKGRKNSGLNFCCQIVVA